MKRLADQTLYEILEVSSDAPSEQIEAAYDKARALYGPGSLVTYTLMEPDEAALLESRIEDARGTLLDPERRARYDEALRERRAEPRAAVVASGGVAPAAPPPVIPAVAPSAPALRDAAPQEEPAARPAILLGAALEAAGPAGDAAEPPRRSPILLDREIAQEAPPRAELPPDAAAPADEPAAVPASASIPGVVVPPPLPETWTGEALRQVREARGLTIQQIAERTKITRHHIENIEGDRFGALPAQVYLRGILLTIARELRLDGQKVARSYIERLPSGTGPAAPKPR